MDRVLKRLKGFQPHNKERHLIAKQLELDDSEYRLWDLFVAASGWDKENIDTYRRLQITCEETARLLNWDTSKANRRIQGLIAKGCIKQVKRSEYQLVIRAERGSEGEDKEIVAQLQEKIASTQSKFSVAQQDVAPTQQNRAYLTTKPLSSYKDNSGVLRSDEEYQKIKEKYGFIELTIDDMKWIDHNVREDPDFHGKTSDQLTDEELLQIFPGATITEARHD